MPRQHRQLPRGITRFNYWGYAFAFPEAASSPRPTSTAQLEQAARVESASRFRRHLAGLCGVPGCVADEEIAERPKDCRAIALLSYIEGDSQWYQDAEAQRVLKGLPADLRARLRESDAAKWRQRRRRLDGLAKIVERDQTVFAYLQEQILAGRLRPDELHQMSSEEQIQAGDITISPATAERIWREYHALGMWLLGRRRLPAGWRGGAERLTAGATREARVVQVTRQDGRQVAALMPGSRQPRAARARRDQPPCRDWPEVYAWLALARRNLTRFKNGHPPLPWRPRRPQ